MGYVLSICFAGTNVETSAIAATDAAATEATPDGGIAVYSRISTAAAAAAAVGLIRVEQQSRVDA